MPRKAGHADVADKIRGAFKTAMTRVDLVDLLENELRERPLDTIRALATWKPPETVAVDMEVTAKGADLDSRGPDAATFMAAFQRAVAGNDESLAGDGEDGSRVPASGHPESTRH